LKHLVPFTNCSLLSAPSKMPSFAFGLPAHRSCPRANGSICQDCYASKGFYRMSNVQRTQDARYAWTRESLKTSAGTNAWISTMVQAIRHATRKGEKLFRIHDSGDFFSAAYANAWYEVCGQLPDVRFWAPTRAWQLPTSTDAVDGLKPFRVLTESDSVMSALLKLASLPNVTIRPSALNFNDAPPMIDGLAAGSAACDANAFGHACPAPKQGNHCGICRVCWHKPNVSVTYHKH